MSTRCFCDSSSNALVSSLCCFGWRGAYEAVALLLGVIAVMMLFSLPMWKKREHGAVVQKTETSSAEISLRAALRVPGMKLSFWTFFFYASLEVSTGLWCGTYLVARGFEPEKGALAVSLMFASVMLGRILSGFFAIKFTDIRLVHAGIALVVVGCFMVLPLPLWVTPVCICLLGFGCAPVYPSLIHATPARFGEELSGRAISIQMAGSYLGSIVMPPAFGFVALHFSVVVWPVALGIFVGMLLLCVCLLDFLTRRRLHNAFAAERIMDALQQMEMLELQRKKMRKERRRQRRKEKRSKLLKSRHL